MTGQTYDALVTFKDVIGWLDNIWVRFTCYTLMMDLGWPINILGFVDINIYLVSDKYSFFFKNK